MPWKCNLFPAFSGASGFSPEQFNTAATSTALYLTVLTYGEEVTSNVGTEYLENRHVFQTLRRTGFKTARIAIKANFSLPKPDYKVSCFFFWWRAPQKMLRTHRSLEAYCANLWWRWLVFSFFRVMEHRWNEIDRGKPKYSGKKPVTVPLCPPQIPHGLTRDRTRASAVTGRRLTAWAMARPK
jgi:hypothetical protein